MNYTDQEPVPDTGFRTLDETLWKPLLSVGGRADPETALEKLALLGRDEDDAMRATVAGILLCTHTPEQWLPSACITATHYRGEDRASGQLDARIITGPTNATPATVAVTVRRDGQPVAGADLLVLFPDNTWKRATTDENGEAALDLYATHLPMTVFVAAKGSAAHLEHGWVPADGALAVELKVLAGGGAVIFPEATGAIPGLKGQLNPIRGPHDRTYLYASNITINQGQEQPVHFSFGEDLRLMDANGVEMWGRIVEIVGRSALVEYRGTEKTKLSWKETYRAMATDREDWSDHETEGTDG